jgi:hypothetical protein
MELYSAKGKDALHYINNLSLAVYGNAAYLLWQDIEKGFYFAEIIDGANYEVTEITDIKRPSGNSNYIEVLPDASTAKIASDNNGNVYALWLVNSGRDYQMFLKARINGIWTDASVINSGVGIVKLPDMKVDNKGMIHIAYIKYIEQGSKEDFACFYLNVEPIK